MKQLSKKKKKATTVSKRISVWKVSQEIIKTYVLLKPKMPEHEIYRVFKSLITSGSFDGANIESTIEIEELMRLIVSLLNMVTVEEYMSEDKLVALQRMVKMRLTKT